MLFQTRTLKQAFFRNSCCTGCDRLWSDNSQKINVVTPGSFCVLEVRRCQVNFSYGGTPRELSFHTKQHPMRFPSSQKSPARFSLRGPKTPPGSASGFPSSQTSPARIQDVLPPVVAATPSIGNLGDSQKPTPVKTSPRDGTPGWATRGCHSGETF